MKASDYAGYQPFDQPDGRYAIRADRVGAIYDALFGVPLGEYDRRAIEWISGLDDSTARVIVGLILRARMAGPYMPPDLDAPATPEEIAATKAAIRAIRRAALDTSADALAGPEEIAVIKRREDA